MYIKRDIEQEIERNLNRKEILAIIGPRQCGKTTLVNHLLKHLKKVNSITFENIKIKNLFEKDIDSFIKLHIDNYDYLFIDEVQYSKDNGQKLKYIYDTCKIKIIISGSSSPDLSIHSLKYLVGRIFIFRLYPFSFNEFLSFKDYKLLPLYKSKKYGNEIINMLNKHLKEFLIFGGYPEVVLANLEVDKKLILKNLYNTYILREIKEILGLSDNDKLIILLKSFSLQIGNLINYAELSNITGFNYNSLKKYVKILEDTFICQRCKPFFTNKRTELLKTPKIYFIDFGFRNICIENFSTNRNDLGQLYENLVFSESIKQGQILKFWRTKSGAEVDFILEQNQNILPLEIKSIPKTSRSFFSFISKYNIKTANILSLTEKPSILRNNCTINFIPFVKFLN